MQKISSIRFQLTVVSDDDARGTNNLTSIAGLIALAQTSPFAQLHRIVDLQKLDVVGLAQSFDELDVFTLQCDSI
jgi:hypothetical protein